VKTVLSTKKLTLSQKELFQNSGFELVEYNAISVSPLEFEIPDTINYAIFTSSNAVEFVFNSTKKRPQLNHVLCVGEKTARKLTDFGQNVIKTAKNASVLSTFILKSYENEVFYFFSGTLRRDEITVTLKSSKNTIFEVKTYKTVLNIRKFDQIFDGIMFFSPSGVTSFTKVNKLLNSYVFCIGDTTARRAKELSDKVYISSATSVESVIEKTVNILKENA
jgi:uroporphyrinogen-III synthase